MKNEDGNTRIVIRKHTAVFVRVRVGAFFRNDESRDKDARSDVDAVSNTKSGARSIGETLVRMSARFVGRAKPQSDTEFRSRRQLPMLETMVSTDRRTINRDGEYVNESRRRLLGTVSNRRTRESPNEAERRQVTRGALRDHTGSELGTNSLNAEHNTLLVEKWNTCRTLVVSATRQSGSWPPRMRGEKRHVAAF